MRDPKRRFRRNGWVRRFARHAVRLSNDQGGARPLTKSAKQRQTRVSELLDTVEAAVRQQDWDRTATNVRTLLTQPMPAELKQQMGMIVQRLKGLNVPQLQGLELPEELPTVPGVPAPGEGGGVPPAGGNRPIVSLQL